MIREWLAARHARRLTEHEKLWGKRRDPGLYPVTEKRPGDKEHVTFAFYGSFPAFGNLLAGYGWWIIGRAGVHNDSAFSFIGERVRYSVDIWKEKP